MKTVMRISIIAVAIATAVGPFSTAMADGGWYVGGSVGRAALELDVGDQSGVFAFDESDTAWKIFGGYVLDLPLIDLGVEGGYVDFGTPSASISAVDVEFDPTGWNLWGVAGFDLGPVGVFGKIGYVAWDVEGETSGAVRESFSDDGTDIAYGVGAKFMLWSLEFRAEYETYDIEDTESVDMFSVGAVWVF
ncbi:MAG: outer membrane beta-barrel protein [Gammaproteobacteria bacterium]|jgi:opacity protein-like surface antigen